MSRKLLWALLLIALSIIVLIFNTGSSVSVSLRFLDIHAGKSLIFFVFMAVGIIIGILLK